MADGIVAAKRLFDKPTFIYGIIDPRDNQLRYVGKTILRLSRRLTAHVSHARRMGCTRHLTAWLRILDGAGIAPEIFLIEAVPPCGDWEDAEQFWIAYFRAIGADLCNHAHGGQGHHGIRHSPDVIERMATKRRTAEGRQRVSAQSHERWAMDRDKIIAAQNAGRGEEWCRNQSNSHQKRWRDNPDNGTMRSNIARRKLSPDDVAGITYLAGSGVSQKTVAVKYRISASMVSRICTGSRRNIP